MGAAQANRFGAADRGSKTLLGGKRTSVGYRQRDANDPTETSVASGDKATMTPSSGCPIGCLPLSFGRTCGGFFRSGDACARPEVTREQGGVGVSVALQGQNKGLARIDEIWIPDPFSVCAVQERIP
jgi:hypothetical protein